MQFDVYFSLSKSISDGDGWNRIDDGKKWLEALNNLALMDCRLCMRVSKWRPVSNLIFSPTRPYLRWCSVTIEPGNIINFPSTSLRLQLHPIRSRFMKCYWLPKLLKNWLRWGVHVSMTHTPASRRRFGIGNLKTFWIKIPPVEG